MSLRNFNLALRIQLLGTRSTNKTPMLAQAEHRPPDQPPNLARPSRTHAKAQRRDRISRGAEEARAERDAAVQQAEADKAAAIAEAEAEREEAIQRAQAEADARIGAADEARDQAVAQAAWQPGL